MTNSLEPAAKLEVRRALGCRQYRLPLESKWLFVRFQLSLGSCAGVRIRLSEHFRTVAGQKLTFLLPS